jgi:two-component system nitrogen regulation response regulator GlnG
VSDDDAQFRQLIATHVRLAGFAPVETADGKAALRLLRDAAPDAALLDIAMPGLSGMAVLKEARQLVHCPPIILITAQGSIASAVEAMREGAFDYLTKPLHKEGLLNVLRRALENCVPGPALEGKGSLRELMGPSDTIQKLSVAIKLVAPTDFTVIIRGETGTGKELVAKAIHKLSYRAKGPFVPLDCGSIPPTLIESELFGHEKGAFTGADRARAGKFEEASGGTLFLDEVQNLSMQVQMKVLRALQEREVYRVAGMQPIGLDVRILAAANEDLAALVKLGRFRADLYHRLNEFGILIPALRDRPTDLIYLANRFMGQTCQELKKQMCGISEAVQEILLAHPWPGNVRELRNVIRRAVLLANPFVCPEHLHIEGIDGAGDVPGAAAEEPGPDQISLKDMMRQSTGQREREILVQVLRQAGGNQAKAARILQVDYKTVRTKAKQYGICVKKKGTDDHGKE